MGRFLSNSPLTQNCPCCKEKRSKMKFTDYGHLEKYNDGCCSTCFRKNMPEQVRHIKLSGKISLTDYVNTYRFLKDIGYDITGDIHLQFCQKYNLEYKEREFNQEIGYSEIKDFL